MTRIAILILSALVLAGCEAPQQSVQIPFAVHFGARPIDCESAGNQLSDLRFFVSDVRLVAKDGGQVAVQLSPDAEWASSAVVLIDLENGQGACSNGSAAVNRYLRGQVPRGDYRGLEFTVGVPFELNHANPLLAEPPLDDSAMHWHWRSGYKFLRAGVRNGDDGFWLHLGSSACRGTTGAIESCDQPNRVRVRLPDFEPGSDQVVIQLDSLFAGVDLEDRVGSDCSSGPAESSCDPVFRVLGLRPGEPAGLADIFVAEAHGPDKAR